MDDINNAKRILITRTDRLGDVVLSTPVIRLIRKKYPEAYVAFMVRPENRDVVRNNSHLNEIIIYDKYGAQKSFIDTLKFSLWLKKKKFDMAIALHPTNRVHLMMFIAGIPIRAGYDREMGYLLTEKIEHSKQEGIKHEIDYNFDLLEKIGIDIAGADRHPYMGTSDDDKKMIDFTQKSYGINANIIALHPGASCRSKRWAPERFAAVADLLAERYGSDIIIVGGDETATLSNTIISAMKHKAVDLTGILLLGELAEFLSRCRILISNDSGPVHVSVAVNTPVVAIFGRNDPGLSPERWGPAGEKDMIIHKNAGCQECLAHNCDKDFECLKAITEEDVINAVGSILGEGRRD